MTGLFSTAFWEISIVLLSVVVLSAVSLAAMVAFLRGMGLIRSKNHAAPPDEMKPPEKKER
ncbi:hypothetical protein [Alkalicoccus chagannorensis]|uniref:hypothetical protein n=1 Tax=Alkalicoccus chagannorensis TaxID=427072 RepID=UPI000406F212|nr:hypothetical protein [Alkalicoccus chagannorensis]